MMCNTLENVGHLCIFDNSVSFIMPFTAWPILVQFFFLRVFFHICNKKIFPHSMGWLFTQLTVFFTVSKLLSIIRCHLFFFCYYFLIYKILYRKYTLFLNSTFIFRYFVSYHFLFYGIMYYQLIYLLLFLAFNRTL